MQVLPVVSVYDVELFTPLDPKLVEELDELDKDARRSAKRSGHTQPIATGRATRPDGNKLEELCSDTLKLCYWAAGKVFLML